MTPALLLLRQWRADRWPPIALVLSIAVVVALATVGPRATATLTREALTGGLSAVGAPQRDLLGQWRSGPTPTPSGDPATIYLEAAESVRAGQATPLADLLGPPELVAEFGFPVSITPPTATGYHRLSFAVLVDASLSAHAEIVSGEWPAPPTVGGPVTEAVVPHAAAMRLGWEVGSEPLPGLRVSGTFRAVDPTHPRWEQIPRGVRYAELEDPNLGTELVSAFFLHRGALATGALGGQPQITHRLWFGVDTSGLGHQPVDVAELSGQLTGILARGHRLTEGTDLPTVELRLYSELGDTLAAVSAQQRTLSSLARVLFMGPSAIGLVLVAVAAAAIVTRRRAALGILRARGMSPGQLARLSSIEGLVLALVGATLGHIVVDLAYPAAGHSWQWWVSLLLSLLLASALPAAHALAPAGLWDRLPARRSTRLRLAVETLILGTAGLALVLLIRDTGGGGVDLLATSAPVLLTLAMGAILWRLYPLPLRVLVSRTRRSRELPALLGALRALRDPAGGAVAMTAVVLGVSMAVMGSVVASSLEATSHDAAWAINGAAVRVAGPRMTEATVARIRQVDGVAAVARIARVEDSVPLRGGDGAVTHVGIWSTEPELLEVYRATPSDPGLPAALFSPDGAMPVILGGTARGGTGPGTLHGATAVDVLGSREVLPGAGTQSAWALVSAERWAATVGSDIAATTALVSLTEGADDDAVADELREQLGAAMVTTADDQLRGGHVRAGEAFGRLVEATTLVTVLLMVLAALGGELISSRSRRATMERMGMLGMTPAETGRSVAWEVTPPVMVATLSGAVLGAGLAVLLLDVLDFSFITGVLKPTVRADPGSLIVVLALVAASAGVLVATAGLHAARSSQEAS